ncbi:MAG: chaperonin GroEL [Mobilitalea sp.]
MSREQKFNQEAKNRMEKGIEKVAKAVAATLGPKGRNAVLDKTAVGGTSIITNDGVSIAKEIILKDTCENMGAQLMIEVATKTNDMVGDGTTTSIVLAYEMIREGRKNLAAGANPILMRKGMKKTVEQVIKSLEKQAVSLTKKEEITQIATISSGNKKVGELIAEAMEKVTIDGFITLEDAKTRDTSLHIINGMRLKTGYLSHYMCNMKKEKKVEYHNPYILITNQIINKVQMILPILEAVKQEKQELLIVAENIDGEALTMLVINDVKGKFSVVGVKAPGFGEFQKDILEDIAILTGGICFFKERGLELKNASLSMLGRADKVIVDKENTLILGGRGSFDKINMRIDHIKKLKEASESEFNRERYRERISKLTNGIAVIQIGADSEIELIEKKLRIEDALAATKAAIAEGIVPGGGCAYIHSIKEVKILTERMNGDEKTGALIILKALAAPCKQIAYNAGMDGAVVADKVLKMGKWMGYDTLLEEYSDLLEAGIIDPLKVVKAALLNAESVVSTLLTIEAVNIGDSL